MRVLRLLIAMVLVLQLSGCAAMFHGTSDQITVQSIDPDATIYLDNVPIGKGSAMATVKRNTVHTVSAKKKGCIDHLVQTQTSFDPVSLLGILIDWGLISMLLIDWAATGAMWETDPLVYHVTPICDDPEPKAVRSYDSPPSSRPSKHSLSDRQRTETRNNDKGRCVRDATGFVCIE